MNVIILKNIIKNYDGLIVLNDIDLVIEEGKFLSIFGPSGYGKTTFYDNFWF